MHIYSCKGSEMTPYLVYEIREHSFLQYTLILSTAQIRHTPYMLIRTTASWPDQSCCNVGWPSVPNFTEETAAVDSAFDCDDFLFMISAVRCWASSRDSRNELSRSGFVRTLCRQVISNSLRCAEF